MATGTVIDAREDGTDLADDPGPPRAPTAPNTVRSAGEDSLAPGARPDEPTDGGLRFQRCRWCRTAFFRRLLCPVCASTAYDWEVGSGTGVILRVVTAGRAGGDSHSTAVIAMDEGYRLRSTVVGTPPEAVRPGARVRLAPKAAHERPETAFRLCDNPYAGLSPAWR